MSPPPEDEPRIISSWTIDTLYVHLSRIVEELEKRLAAISEARLRMIEVAIKSVEQSAAAALASSDRATNKAEDAMEKRFDAVNEFRQTLGDQAKQFITREEVQSGASSQGKEMAGLASRLDRIEAAQIGKQDTEKSHKDNTGLWIALGAMLAAFLAVAIGAVGLFIGLYHKA